MYAVKITYFTFKGKYFTTGTYATENEQLYSIWKEVERKLRMNRSRPGFAGYTELFFHALIEVPNHEYNTPYLIPNIKTKYRYKKPERKKPWIPPEI